MKRNIIFLTGVLFISTLGITVNVFANEATSTRNKLISKGAFEYYDEASDSRTIIDAKDLYLLADTIDSIDKDIEEVNNNMRNNLESLVDKIDMLDGEMDKKIGEADINISFENLLDGIDSYANKEIKAVNAKSTEESCSYIQIPENGFYTKDSYLKIDNKILTDANPTLVKEIEKKVTETIMKSMEIHKNSGSITDTVTVPCHWENSHSGGCTFIEGSGTKQIAIWKNTTNNIVKFIPSSVSGNVSLQGEASIPPGGSVYAYLRASVYYRPGGTGDWGAWYGYEYEKASGSYTYFLLY